MEYKTKILETKVVAKNIIRIKMQKPKDYEYPAGYSATFTINKEGLKKFKKPITFTSAPYEDFLEIMVKNYSEKKGLSNEFYKLKKGEELFLTSPYGKIKYLGPGTFIAGGIGITPFISIMRSLKEEGKCANVGKIIYSNSTKEEIVQEEALRECIGTNLHLTLTKESKPGFQHGRISRNFLEEANVDLEGFFYLCGPLPLVKSLRKILDEMGIPKDKIIG